MQETLTGLVAQMISHQYQHHDAHDIGGKGKRQNGGHDNEIARGAGALHQVQIQQPHG